MADNYIADRAEKVLFEGMETLHNNVIQIGHYQKEIKKIEDESQKLAKEIVVPAAHYYNKERIRELHQNTIALLKCNDFDPEEYIAIFSDSSKIKLEHIHFLWKRQKQLADLKQILNVREDEKSNTKKDSKLFDALADLLVKDGANND